MFDDVEENPYGLGVGDYVTFVRDNVKAKPRAGDVGQIVQLNLYKRPMVKMKYPSFADHKLFTTDFGFLRPSTTDEIEEHTKSLKKL